MKIIAVKIPEGIRKFLLENDVYQKALDRLNDTTDEVVTLEEMNEEIQ